MEVIKVTTRNAVKKAVRHLKEGGIIVYPTETSYGIGARITDAKALKGILSLKGSNKREAFLVLVSGIPMARKFVDLGKVGRALAKEYWPGPLTIIAPLRKRVCPQIVNKKNEMAVRYSENKIATKIVSALKEPITSTSANRSGASPCFSKQEIIRKFGKKRLEDILILDAGRLPKRVPSALVRVTGDKLKVLRQRGRQKYI